jgi:hypothetical protein
MHYIYVHSMPSMYLGAIRWDVMDWIHPAEVRNQWGALVKTVMNLWGP